MMFIAMLNPEPDCEKDGKRHKGAGYPPRFYNRRRGPMPNSNHARNEHHNANRERVIDEQISDHGHGPRFITSRMTQPDRKANADS
jgi:hypothetical protein